MNKKLLLVLGIVALVWLYKNRGVVELLFLDIDGWEDLVQEIGDNAENM